MRQIFDNSNSNSDGRQQPVDQPHSYDVQYDYDNQAWIVNGLYVKCGHKEPCRQHCYGTLHEGKKAPSIH